MSAPVDEIDVGRDPRGRAPWHDWSTGRRRTVTVGVVVAVLVAAALWFVTRGPVAPPAPTAATAPVDVVPGADVTQAVAPATAQCPPGARCDYEDRVSDPFEDAFRAAFGSAGYIGRTSVLDADTGEVYWQLIRFTTGTLITVTLTQQPVSQLPAPPVVHDTPGDVDRKNGAVDLTTVRDGYLMTANAAGLPGQVLPVPSVQQWLQTVPAP